MIEYPQGLPYPLRDGLSLQTVDPALRTQMQSGFARQRRQYTSTPTMAQVSWHLTEQQAVLFEAFFEEVLVSGSLWFECAGIHRAVLRYVQRAGPGSAQPLAHLRNA